MQGPSFSAWIQQRMSNYHRRKGYRFLGMDILFLTTVGRTSGEPRETPLAWFPDGDNAWLIVASAAGSAKHPGWYLNLAAHPDQLSIELPDRHVRVGARQLHGPGRDQAWRRIVAAQPRYQKYQAKTDRELPVIRLVGLRRRPCFDSNIRATRAGRLSPAHGVSAPVNDLCHRN